MKITLQKILMLSCALCFITDAYADEVALTETTQYGSVNIYSDREVAIYTNTDNNQSNTGENFNVYYGSYDASEASLVLSTGQTSSIIGTATGTSLTLDSTSDTAIFASDDGTALVLTGVADGSVSANSTDAINGSQLYTLQSGVTELEQSIADETTARENADLTLQTNITEGDAATLASANSYTDSQITRISNKLDDVEKKAYRGVAIALAAQQQVPNISPGQLAVFAGVGHYEGESASALGLVGMFPDGRTSLSGALGVASGGDIGGRVGIAYVFGGK